MTENFKEKKPPQEEANPQLRVKSLPKRCFKKLIRYNLILSKTEMKEQVIKKKMIRIWHFDDKKNKPANNNFSPKRLLDRKMTKNLTELKLISSESNSIVNQRLHQTIECLKRQRSLQRLKIQLFEFGRYGDEELALISKGFMKIKRSLQELDISISWITDKGVENLTQGLKRHASLEELSLDLEKCSITWRGAERLSSSLKTLNCLKMLYLCVGENKLTDRGISPLSKAIGKLTSLQNLQIIFQYCSFSGEGLGCLAESLQKIGSKLTSLHFLLNCNPKLSNRAFLKLVEAFKSMPFLEFLYLDVAWCKKITDQGLERLLSSLRKLSSLIKFEFYGIENKEITNESHLKFVNGIKRLRETTKHPKEFRLEGEKIF